MAGRNPDEQDGRDARTPGGPFGWLRLRSRWVVSLASLELQVQRGCGLGSVDGWQESGRAEVAGTLARNWPGREALPK
ncbi:MAG: hypothetical protein M0Q13_06920 [Methanothrix sp.]|nr:hypothetical protein [Methanothrix sp.]